MTNEMDFLQEEQAELNTEVAGEEVATTEKDDRTWEVDGVEVSKSEFIRHQFTNNNLSRKEISEQFDINYRTVYGATVNMVNDAEPTSRGRSAANVKINVTLDNEVVVVTEDGVTVDGKAYEGEAPETAEVDRNTWIREQVEAGKGRGEIATALGLSYGVVYGLTKDIAGVSQRHEIEYEGKLIPRSEYIRILHAQGMEKGAIAKELGVDYPVVWSALKGLKSEEEKFQDAIGRLEKYKANAADPEAFDAAIQALRAVAFKAEEAEESTDTEAEATDAE